MYSITKSEIPNIIIYVSVTIATIILILTLYNKQLLVMFQNKQYVSMVTHFGYLLFVYSLMYIQLLFCWWKWGMNLINNNIK